MRQENTYNIDTVEGASDWLTVYCFSMLFHSRFPGIDKSAAMRALAKGKALAQGAGLDTVRIAAHSKNSFRVGIFSRIFEPASLVAIAGGWGDKAAEVTVTLLTELESPAVTVGSPLIAAHVSPEWLTRLIAEHADDGLIYLPWSQDDLQFYLLKNPSSQPID